MAPHRITVGDIISRAPPQLPGPAGAGRRGASPDLARAGRAGQPAGQRAARGRGRAGRPYPVARPELLPGLRAARRGGQDRGDGMPRLLALGTAGDGLRDRGLQPQGGDLAGGGDRQHRARGAGRQPGRSGPSPRCGCGTTPTRSMATRRSWPAATRPTPAWTSTRTPRCWSSTPRRSAAGRAARCCRTPT